MRVTFPKNNLPSYYSLFPKKQMTRFAGSSTQANEFDTVSSEEDPGKSISSIA